MRILSGWARVWEGCLLGQAENAPSVLNWSSKFIQQLLPAHKFEYWADPLLWPLEWAKL